MKAGFFYNVFPKTLPFSTGFLDGEPVHHPGYKRFRITPKPKPAFCISGSPWTRPFFIHHSGLYQLRLVDGKI